TADRLDIMLGPTFADAENRLLRLAHDLIDGVAFVRQRGDLVRRIDHLAADGIFLHDMPVRFRVQGGGDLVDQRGKICRTADLRRIGSTSCLVQRSLTPKTAFSASPMT